MRPALSFSFLPGIAYSRGLELMEEAARMLSGGHAASLLMFEHTPSITLGVRTAASSVLLADDELARRGITCYRTDRGGDATWHGPGQLTGYPVVDLKTLGLTVPAYVGALETAIMEWLEERGAQAVRIKGRPGVWMNGREKIASIGVRVSNGVATHGFALNLCGPMPGSDAIVPCGLRGVRLVTLESARGPVVKPAEAAPGVAARLASALGMELSVQVRKDPET
ncbi:MAG: lipoyl(octanoyl) transferase LipB [Myxococcota bacterium]|jgi:lipoyl(octanoyl) transferase